MIIKVYIPRDSAAKAVGADEVAAAIAAEAAKRNISVHIIRNSSRGMLWLETFVEVETAQGRVGYGPVEASDVASLFEACSTEGGKHKLGPRPGRRPALAEEPGTPDLRPRGITDPVSVADYVAHGGFEGLKKALAMAVPPSWRRSPNPACVAVAEQASPQASNGKPFTMPRPTRNMSAATPMKATAAPLPTAW